MINLNTNFSRNTGEQDQSKFIVDAKEAQKLLPNYSEEEVCSLLQINRGKEGSHMTTLGLEQVVEKTKQYCVGTNGLKLTNEIYAIDLEERASKPSHIQIPPFVQIKAKWEKQAIESGNGNNILGDNGLLSINQEVIHIPVVEATTPLLAHYGAILINKGETIRFPNDIYPIFRMNIGKNYVENFIMSKEGGGFYLEFHTDQPHFHMPIKGGGYYLLGKWDADHTHLQLTAFTIPDRCAVYTKKGAIHCDAALTGELIVGYNISNDCSTVLLRQKQDVNQRVDLKFV
jgi:hypothetical protein